ncbi:DUF4192 domain-containing protein [Actinotalea solisilvae]|uniref:DUF4192 domain-containing protein n=1 Tax=Actinotalea solisilvae TaxID=2072922 RepID=UPI0018F23093|nr:DUF4192 domain-containing protein [Actinotalea solisilvae]
MPTTIRTSEPRELLSLIPFQLGFQPTESAVLLSLRGERSRVGLVARVDLADVADPEHGGHVARSVVRHLEEDGATRAVLVLYPGRSRAAAAGLVRDVRAVVGDAAAHLFGQVDCWVVGPGGYYAPDCADPGCCPGEGRPLEELASTRVGAEMVLSGAAVLPSRDDVGRIPPASEPARRAARRAAQRWSRRVEGAVDPGELHAWRREGLALWRAEVEHAVAAMDAGVRTGTATGRGAARGRPAPGPLEPVVAGRLQAFLADVLCRDAALLGFVPGSARAADRLVAGDSTGVAAVLAAIFEPRPGVAPDPVLAAASTVLLEQVVAHSARRGQGPALTLLGVLAWWQGDGARAAVLVDRALRSEPGYRLALLVDEALAAGLPPGWIRRSTA